MSQMSLTGFQLEFTSATATKWLVNSRKRASCAISTKKAGMEAKRPLFQSACSSALSTLQALLSSAKRCTFWGARTSRISDLRQLYSFSLLPTLTALSLLTQATESARDRVFSTPTSNWSLVWWCRLFYLMLRLWSSYRFTSVVSDECRNSPLFSKLRRNTRSF